MESVGEPIAGLVGVILITMTSAVGLELGALKKEAIGGMHRYRRILSAMGGHRRRSFFCE